MGDLWLQRKDAAQKLSRLNAELQQHLTTDDWSSALLLGCGGSMLRLGITALGRGSSSFGLQDIGKKNGNAFFLGACHDLQTDFVGLVLPGHACQQYPLKWDSWTVRAVRL